MSNKPPRTPRWNTEDFVFDEPIIKSRPKVEHRPSLGRLLILMGIVFFVLAYFAIFCVGLATLISYFTH